MVYIIVIGDNIL